MIRGINSYSLYLRKATLLFCHRIYYQRVTKALGNRSETPLGECRARHTQCVLARFCLSNSHTRATSESTKIH